MTRAYLVEMSANELPFQVVQEEPFIFQWKIEIATPTRKRVITLDGFHTKIFLFPDDLVFRAK